MGIYVSKKKRDTNRWVSKMLTLKQIILYKTHQEYSLLIHYEHIVRSSIKICNKIYLTKILPKDIKSIKTYK